VLARVDGRSGTAVAAQSRCGSNLVLKGHLDEQQRMASPHDGSVVVPFRAGIAPGSTR
jgi:hypothetical protein